MTKNEKNFSKLIDIYKLDPCDVVRRQATGIMLSLILRTLTQRCVYPPYLFLMASLEPLG